MHVCTRELVWGYVQWRTSVPSGGPRARARRRRVLSSCPREPAVELDDSCYSCFIQVNKTLFHFHFPHDQLELIGEIADSNPNPSSLPGTDPANICRLTTARIGTREREVGYTANTGETACCFFLVFCRHNSAPARENLQNKP